MSQAKLKKKPTATQKLLQSRLSGILVHPSSLPGGYGIGDLGSSSHEFVDFLSSAKQSIWQVLPLGPTSLEEFHSPYATVSAFAGNPLLISLDSLIAEGLLERGALKRQLAIYPINRDRRRVNLKELPNFMAPLLLQAVRNFSGVKAEREIESFINSNPWANDYSEYAALRTHFRRPRFKWPREFRLKTPQTKRALKSSTTEADIRAQIVIQLLFFKQWNKLRRYANSRGVRLFGDLPIYVSNDSADVWANPRYFELDRQSGAPTLLSGVPPDLFNSNGQLWGHPLYNWSNIKKDRFSWWIKRFRAAQESFDLVRLDHFRGFESYWAVPGDAKIAKHGRWLPCPGRELFSAVQNDLGELPIFVEDLGVITEPVDALRESFGLMGTRVLQFAFSGDPQKSAENRDHPINIPQKSVVFTGTHDNAPSLEWFSELPRANKLKLRGVLNDCSSRDVARNFTRLALASPAKFCILPMQDVLEVGKGNRMNYPGLADWKNWSWRFEKISSHTAKRLAHLTDVYERCG
jgi:4-alpha-glucanotransferase